MKRLCILLTCLYLAACASDGPPIPSERRAADHAARSGSAASQNGFWKSAAAHWADAALRYSRIDDWTEAGYAQIGAAQARDKLSDPAAAQALLQALISSPLYPAEVKAEAQFQLALWSLRQPDIAATNQHLDAAEQLAAPEAALRAAIHNTRARLAASIGDWNASRTAATAALAVKAITPAERANALRRQAEAMWRLGDTTNAVLTLKSALALDRELARPGPLREDHCLLATMLVGSDEGALHTASCEALRRLEGVGR